MRIYRDRLNTNSNIVHNYKLIVQNQQINTNEYLSSCDSKDVISFNNQQWISIAKLKNIVYRAFIDSGITSVINRIAQITDFKDASKTKTWFYTGQECEILRAGSKGWQKGKIKINVTLEFVPDEVEESKSLLDDIRQTEIN